MRPTPDRSVAKPGFLVLAVLVFGSVPAAAGVAAGLKPDEAVAAMTTSAGFRVDLIAGDGTVSQPIAATCDARGRLYVAEFLSYPNVARPGEGRDRILVFDPDGKGGFQARPRVFWDKGTYLSGIACGMGGVWAMSVPNLLFIPDQDGDGVADGAAEVVLEGWSKKYASDVVNGLVWGPDGWLYGGVGLTAGSDVGAPGSSTRVRIDPGAWRFHPTRRIIEQVCKGGTNHWGVDFDDDGNGYLLNTVNMHLMPLLWGAHFETKSRKRFVPDLDRVIDGCADHLHWGAKSLQDMNGRDGPGVFGGGHAHAGLVCYLGAAWPESFRNRLLMGNIHGNRLNTDRLERQGSGWVAKHDADLLLANDLWFRPSHITPLPDGNVAFCDWNETGECHAGNHPSGRVYRLSYGEPRPRAVDLPGLADGALVDLQSDRDEWWVRRARLELQWRADRKKLAAPTAGLVRTRFATENEVRRKLRLLWTLHAIGDADETFLLGLLDAADDRLRAWAVQLLSESIPSAKAIDRLVKSAQSDPSATVRLRLASMLQRLPPADRWTLAEALVTHGEDADDRFLPAMIWFGLAPAVVADLKRAEVLAGRCALPSVVDSIRKRTQPSPR